jgi:hypothetical protein
VVLPCGLKGTVQEAFLDPVTGQRRVVIVVDKPKRHGKNPGPAANPPIAADSFKD